MTTTLGGLGGDCRFTIRDARLVERAVREHWPIPEPLRGTVTDRLGAIVDDAKAGPRAVTAAARASCTHRESTSRVSPPR